MAVQKLSANQQRKVDTIHQYQMVVVQVKRLVAELDGNRAARAKIIDNICASLARQLSQLRQRAMTAPVGTVGDIAGALAVLAARGGSGLAFKIRGLHEGVNSLNMQLEAALKSAMEPEKDEKH
jgi:hypothetical protein